MHAFLTAQRSAALSLSLLESETEVENISKSLRADQSAKMQICANIKIWAYISSSAALSLLESETEVENISKRLRAEQSEKIQICANMKICAYISNSAAQRYRY
jgi:hypothetical protein